MIINQIHHIMKKTIYEKPQSQAIRLPAPNLLQAGSGFRDKDGDWDDIMMFNPGSIEDLL